MMKTLTLTFLCFATATFAQKKPLNHSVYDSWESIGIKQLSDNGQWAAYSILQQEGDANLYLNSLTGLAKINIPRGEKPKFSPDKNSPLF
ncbi:hypothetical protein [Pedobacter sp. NJ-S-72]